MAIPPDLRHLVEECQDEVFQNPGHVLGFSKRQQIYDAFGAKTDETGHRARSMLAIITAKRVLPIFEQALPNEKSTRQLIEMTEDVVRGTVDTGKALEEGSEGYELVGTMWGFPEDEVPWNAWFAGMAAVRALLETATGDPFRQRNTLWKFKKSGSGESKAIPADQWPEEDLAQNGGDAASAAAAAWACDKNSPKCDPKKLLEFWKWWLLEAIRAAWESAEQPVP